jgi:ABC-type sugar transport system ATPase subunit
MLEARQICHSYGQTEVLGNISIDFEAGLVTAVMGGNGTGKSTLMKILSGALRPTGGEVLLCGDSAATKTIAQARRHKVWMSDQEGGLIPAWSVRDHFSILAGQPEGAPWKELAPDVDEASLIEDLQQGERQLVEIALACAGGSNVTLLDEPTAGQSREAKDAIHSAMSRAANAGAAVIWVTHDIRSALAVADRLVVLKGGVVSFDALREDATYEGLLQHIVRDGEASVRPNGIELIRESGTVAVMEVVSKSGETATISQGEIVGIVGNARTRARDILRSAAGLAFGRKTDFWIRLDAIRREQLAYMSRERANEWDFGGQSLAFCLAAGSWPKLSAFGFVQSQTEEALATKLCEDFGIIASSIDDPIESLSGGNRQKALLARLTSMNPTVLLLDEPFSGVDAQARLEIKQQLEKLAGDMTVVVYTNEWDDLAGFADTVLGLREGGDIHQLQGREISTANIELALVAEPKGVLQGLSV